MMFKFQMMKSTPRVFTALVRRNSRMTQEKIIISPAPPLTLSEGNFVNMVFKDVNKWWMKPAIECSESGVIYTYAELLDQINKWSRFLQSFGTDSQDSIAIISPNCLQIAPIFFGSLSLGTPATVLNPMFTSNELRRMILKLGSKFIVYSREVEDIVSLALKEDISKFQLFSLGKPMKLNALNVDDIIYGKNFIPFSQPPQATGEKTAYIPFSSGTSGIPKAVELSHNGLSNMLYSYTNPYHNITWKPEGLEQSVIMGMLPFFHISGMIITLSFGFLTGGKIVIFPKYSQEEFLEGIRKFKITRLFVTPSILNSMITSSKCTEETIQSLDTMICSSAPVLRSSVDTFKKRFKSDIDLIEGYGMSEFGFSTVMPRNCKNLIGSGRLLSNVKAKIICPENGETLGPNQKGEICIKSPSIMKGYLNDQRATNDVLKNGWIHTGDVGYYDEGEYFFVTDRIKELIKVDGRQVSPSEIENELLKHLLVEECSVIGKPDPKHGELPLAFVVPKEEVSEAELHNFLKDKLVEYKQLKGGIKFVDSLPKSKIGKILKRELRLKV